jgi:opacity protein-like surface antigen
MKTKIALMVAMALAAGSAVAADNDGFYVGAGLGYSNWNVNDGRLDNSVNSRLADSLCPTCEVASSSTTQTATPFMFQVGYRFMDYFAAELGYIDNGGSNYKGQVFDTETSTRVGVVKGTRSGSGWPVSLLGIYPINETWDVFGRAGVYFGTTDTRARAVLDDGTLLAQDNNNGKSSTNFVGGLGVDAHFMGNWFARAEWLTIPSFGDTHYGSGNLNAFMATLNYKF